MTSPFPFAFTTDGRERWRGRLRRVAILSGVRIDWVYELQPKEQRSLKFKGTVRLPRG
jgi:hypothetical protein